MASAFEEAAVVPPDSGYVFDWPGIQERPDSKLEVRYFIGEARYVAFLLDFNDFWFNGRYQYYKFDGQSLDRNELAVLCGQEEAEKLRREPGRKLKAFVPSQSSWVALRSLREAQMKQQQQLQHVQGLPMGVKCTALNSEAERQKKAKLYEEYVTEEKQMNGAYSACRELTVPKEWARDEFKNRDFPLQIKLQVRLNGTLLPEQYEVKVSRDNRQDRASRRYRIALTSTLRELGELVQASRFISEWRRMSEELIIISVNNTAATAPPPKVMKEEVREDSLPAWDDEATAFALAAEDCRLRPSTRARTLQKAMSGAPPGSSHGGYFSDSDEPIPGLRDLLQTMWADQQYMLEQHVADSIGLEERHKKSTMEHEAKVTAMQQEHHAQLTKLQSKQQADILKAVQRHYSDSGNQRNGQLIDQYRCEVQLMNERHGAQLGKLASKQEAELQALLEKQQQELRKLEERISRLVADHQDMLQSAFARHQDAVCSKVERYQVALQDEWQRCFHQEEEEAAVTLANLAGGGGMLLAGTQAQHCSSAAAADPSTAGPSGCTATVTARDGAVSVTAGAACIPETQQPHASCTAADGMQPLPCSSAAPEATPPVSPLSGAADDNPSRSWEQSASPSMSHLIRDDRVAETGDMHPRNTAAFPAAPSHAAPPAPPPSTAPLSTSAQQTAQLPSLHALPPQPFASSASSLPTASVCGLPPFAVPSAVLGASVHLQYTAAHHQVDLERYGSTPSCLPCTEQLVSCSTTSCPAGVPPVAAAAADKQDCQPMPREVCSAPSSPAPKRMWVASPLAQLPEEGMEPPIKRPHKLMVKLVHA